MKRPRLLIADDHTIVLEGLRMLLAADFDVIGMVEDGRAMVNAAQQLVPDVASHDVFICGSPGWMDAAERAVLRAGVPPECIHIERQGYPSEPTLLRQGVSRQGRLARGRSKLGGWPRFPGGAGRTVFGLDRAMSCW